MTAEQEAPNRRRPPRRPAQSEVARLAAGQGAHQSGTPQSTNRSSKPEGHETDEKGESVIRMSKGPDAVNTDVPVHEVDVA